MNKVDTNNNGGFPVVLDDLRFTEQSFREAIYGIMSSYGVAPTGTFILSGCNRTVVAGQIQISEGYISILGEICHVPLQTYGIPSAGQFEYFTIQSSFDPTGLKVFENGTSGDTYNIRKAKITIANTLPANVTTIQNAKSIYQLMHDKLNTNNWIDFANNLEDGFFGVGATPESYKRRYFKDIDGFVHLRGIRIMDDLTSPTNLSMGILPVGYRPAEDLFFVITYYISANAAKFYNVQIKANGEINVVGAVGNGNLALNQIPPFRAV